MTSLDRQQTLLPIVRRDSRTHSRQSSMESMRKTLSSRAFIASVPNTPIGTPLIRRPKAHLRDSLIPAEPVLRSKLDFYASYHHLQRDLDSKRGIGNPSAQLAYLQCIEREKVSPTPVGILHAKQGQNNIISVPFAFIGDRLALALSQGLKFSKALEGLNLRGNRLGSLSSEKIIKRLQPATIKDVDMSGNKIGKSAVLKLVGILEVGGLVTLQLENCGLTNACLEVLLKSATVSKTLRELNVARNNLGEQSGKQLGNFLMYTSSLKVLDVHWNCIRANGATQLFLGLKENEKLEVLDVSWNMLDSHDAYGLSAAIAAALALDDHLRHLDLSFNYLSKEQCGVIATGLSDNHTLYGLHILGNYCYIDTKAFLHPSDTCDTEQANYFRRILRGAKPKGQNCWLCDEWVEVELTYQGLAAPPVFLHMEIDQFQPYLMHQTGGMCTLKRAVPPGLTRFFFTSNGVQELSGAYTASHEHTHTTYSFSYWEGFSKAVTIDTLQVYDAHEPVCTLGKLFGTHPRVIPDVYTPDVVLKEKEPWSLPISLFKTYRFDTEDLLSDCFEFDWTCSRIPKLVKDPTELAVFKEMLRKSYKHM